MRPYDVLLCGYYGFGNLGDDLLLESLLGLLEEGGTPRSRVAVLFAGSGGAPSGVRLFDRWSPPEILRALRASRALLLGGGGLFQDSTSLRSCLYYWGILRLARALGCRPWAFGQSVGPLKSPCARFLAGDALKLCSPLVIRDRPSLEVLKELGISGEIAGDPVLTLSAPSPIMFGEALAVNLRPWPGELLPGAVRALREYLDRRGWPAVGIAMAAEDQELLSGLRDRGELPLRRVHRVRSAREFYEALGGCAGLAAMRLHALILGSVAGVSLLALPYDPKVAGFAESRGLPAGVEAIPSWNPGRLSDPGAREAASASVRGAFAEARRRWEEEGT